MASSTVGQCTPAIAPALLDHADRRVKRKTCDLDFDTLECPICTHLLSPPIFQCNNGHTACANCCEKLPNKLCPSCALPIGNTRCMAVEKIIESLLVRCKHAVRGCKEKLPLTKSDEHEEVCGFRSFHCPLVGCSYEGIHVNIALHFEKRHGAQVFKLDSDIDDGKLFLDMKFEAKLFSGEAAYIVVQCCKETSMFLLHYQFDEALCIFRFFVSSFGQCSRSYRLSITFDRQGISHSSSIEAPVSDNQFVKDWITNMEQQCNFLAVLGYEKPSLNDKAKDFEMDLELL